ncbi:hypothetical protein SAMD00019534_009840 [Acytostelium subglobosum LB1]|uniref:hypothetical protein n=1 Tax=Acytostelium subglobosum LB1 TaxID=1410327 RepID=UPI000644E849|nr:hypothetical protein SAMD00019534_009840 [Acytostelium subglobosum LB1]GAM17809.1 hypothetical protein SAMD00019534_009840 [Acytostelium subglobosum LB1]|eukprot:XP_012758405.1 hypothetical protein SAMD00019534_009840 [Acytostelium subglobosum LB1]
MSQLPILSSSSVGSYDQQQYQQQSTQQQLFPDEDIFNNNFYEFDPQQHVVGEDVNSNLHLHVDDHTDPYLSNGYQAGDDVSQFYSTAGDWHPVNHTVTNQEQSVSYQPPETPQSCYTPQQPPQTPQTPQTPDPPQQQYLSNYYPFQSETGINFIPQHQTQMPQQPMMPSHISTQELNSQLVSPMCPQPLAHLSSQMTQPSSLSPLSPLSQPLTNQHSQLLASPLQQPQQPFLNQLPQQMCQPPWTHLSHQVPTSPLPCYEQQHPSLSMPHVQPTITIPLEYFNNLMRQQQSSSLLSSPPQQQHNTPQSTDCPIYTANPFAQLGHPSLLSQGVVEQQAPLQQQLCTYSQLPDACASPAPSDSSELTSDSFSSDSYPEIAPPSPPPLKKAKGEGKYLSREHQKMRQTDAALVLGISSSFLSKLRSRALEDSGLNPEDHPWPHRLYVSLKKKLRTSKRNREKCIQRGTNKSQNDAAIAKIKKDIDLMLTPMWI